LADTFGLGDHPIDEVIVTGTGCNEACRQQRALERFAMFQLADYLQRFDDWLYGPGEAEEVLTEIGDQLRNIVSTWCSLPPMTTGVQLQLNRGFLGFLGFEGQVALTGTSHGQIIWTQSVGGVVGVNHGLVLSGSLQIGMINKDPPGGFTPYSTIGGELIVAEVGGASIGVTAPTDGSGYAFSAIDAGFAVGGGVVAGANYQKGLAVTYPSPCELVK
jgi:hypothetical protein